MGSVLLLSTALLWGQAAPEPVPPGAVASIAAPLLPAESARPAEGPTPAAVAPSAAERWPLMQALQGTWPGWLLDGNRLKVYGWIEGSFTGSSVGRDNTPEGANFNPNEFSVNQAWLRVERPVDTSATTPTFGFRSDTYVGTDFRYTVARGLFSGQLTSKDGGPHLYGVDPIQFYAEAYFPQVGRGLDVKLGRFYTLFGAESSDTTQNLLLSRSYNWIYDPFTNTGAVATLKLTDAWSVQGGLVLGSDVFIDPADRLTGIGGVRWAPPAGRDSVLFSFIVGPGRFEPQRNFNNPQIFDLVWTHKFSTRLNYTLDALLGCQTNVPTLGNVYWYTVAQYFNYALTPRLSAVARLEFFDDCQGQRTGFKGLYSALATGLNFRPRPWLLLRPEVRVDYNDESRPFENRAALFTAGMDIVVRW
jgi:hypothetical protein